MDSHPQLKHDSVIHPTTQPPPPPRTGCFDSLPRLSAEELAFFNSFPPGYRFRPEDDELIIHYLRKKVHDQKLPPNKIIDVDIYKFNPEALAVLYEKYGENEWYFFTPRDKKYKNGSRPSRAAGDGYWKATGADKPIKHKNALVGYRRALVFYRGKPPHGTKTNWIMHEYRVSDPPPPRVLRNDSLACMRLDDSVLCRIYKKSEKPRTRNNRGEVSVDVSEDGTRNDNDDNRYGITNIVARESNNRTDSSASYGSFGYGVPSPFEADYDDRLQPSEANNYEFFRDSGIALDLAENYLNSGISNDNWIHSDPSHQHSYRDQNACNMVSLEKIFSRDPSTSNHDKKPYKLSTGEWQQQLQPSPDNYVQWQQQLQQSPDIYVQWQQQFQQSPNIYGEWHKHQPPSNACGESQHQQQQQHQHQHQSTFVIRKRRLQEFGQHSSDVHGECSSSCHLLLKEKPKGSSP